MQRSKLVVLLPPGPDTSMTQFRPLALAAENARFVKDTVKPEILCELNVQEEAELGGAESVEMLGSSAASVEMPCNVALPFFTLHVKDIGRFCGFELVIEDSSGQPKHVLVSNKQSRLRVGPKSASLPLLMTLGWNKITLDMRDVCAKAFGTEYVSVRNVVLHPSCRIARVYFEVRPHEDAELPDWLRTIR